MLWLGVAYLAALAALFITSLWTQNDFTGDIERVWTLDNFRQLWDDPGLPDDHVPHDRDRGAGHGRRRACSRSRSRSTWPRSRRRAVRRLLVIAVLMPLWASYLVKAYAWRGMFSAGRADRLARRAVRAQLAGLRAGRDHDHAGLPVAAVHDPADLRRPRAGARLAVRGLRRPRRRRAGRTFRRVVLPMAFPAIVAGSIFTFSLTLGDYIAVTDRRRHRPAARQRRLRQRRRGQQPAVRRGGRDRSRSS